MIRINRLGVLFGLVAAATLPAPVSAQVVYRDRWVEQQEAKIRAEIQRDRMYDQQTRLRETQGRSRDEMRVQLERTRDQQAMIRERALERSLEQLERSREQREREIERAQELRERMLERSRDQRELALERAQEARERAEEVRQRALERARDQQINEFPLGRRIYISPPPNVRLRSRWP